MIYPDPISLYGMTSPGEGVRKVSREFEALFIYELLKGMRGMAGKGLFGEGLSGDVFQTLFEMELARVLAERGTGLSEVLVRTLEGRGREVDGVSGEALHPGPETGTAVDAAAVSEEVTGGRTPAVSIEPPRGSNAVPGVEAGDRRGRLPVEGRITSGFGRRIDPITGETRVHRGVDIAAAPGTEVYPLRAGKVIFSGALKGFGNIVVIEHDDGMVTRYAHNQRNLVKAGDRVAGDTPIALVGSTGRSTGPHLHFEVLEGGRHVDPLEVV